MLLQRRNSGFNPVLNSFYNDDYLNSFFNRNNVHTCSENIPAVNIKENENTYEIEVAAPGINKEDFQLNVENNILTISAKKEETKEYSKNDEYSRKEFSYQDFERNIRLGENRVETESISAKYENGILKISLPKLEHAKAKGLKSIEIS